MNQEEVEREIDAFNARMSEHVESVRVFVTMPQDGMTAAISRGAGNYYAQVGHAREWLNARNCETAAEEIGRVIAPPDDADDWKNGV